MRLPSPHGNELQESGVKPEVGSHPINKRPSLGKAGGISFDKSYQQRANEAGLPSFMCLVGRYDWKY